jgi:hypothetical protein
VRTITVHPSVVRRAEPLRIGVVVEGVAALLGLVVFIGVLCGLVTWALVHLISAGIS